MSRALVLLLWLQLVAWLRYLRNSVLTVRGAILGIIGLSVFVPWLIAVVVGSMLGGTPGVAFGKYGPAALLVYCVLNVLVPSQKRTIYFSPAEVQFLFSGPFGRREVLVYKLCLTLLVSVPAALVLAAVLRVRHGWFPATVLGLGLVSVFAQLFSMTLGLLADAAGERLYSWGRRAALAAVVGVALVVLYQTRGTLAARDWQSLGDEILATRTWQVVTWPLQAFFDLMVATRLWPDLVVNLTVALGVLTLLVGLIFSLDAHYEEAAAANSARIYARIQRLRGRSVTVDPPATVTRARWALPMFPYLGGVGPIFWRQLTGALRGLTRLLSVVGIFCVLITGLLFSVDDDGLGLVQTLPFAGVYLALFMPTLVPFDFRGDIDRIGGLKTLPIPGWRIALGQVLTPTLLLTVFQGLLLGLVGAIVPGEGRTLLAVAACLPVVCFVVVALENLLFLLFPVRIFAVTPGDFQALGRNAVLAACKLVGLGTFAAAAATAGVVVGYGLESLWLGVAAGVSVLVVVGASLVALCAVAFRWFDIGRTTPA